MQAHGGGIFNCYTLLRSTCYLHLHDGILLPSILNIFHVLHTCQLLLVQQTDQYFYIFCLFPKRTQRVCNKTHVNQSNQITVGIRPDTTWRKWKGIYVKGQGLGWDHLNTRLISQGKKWIHDWLYCFLNLRKKRTREEISSHGGTRKWEHFRWQLPYRISFVLIWHSCSFLSPIKKFWSWVQYSESGLLTSPLKSVQCNLTMYYTCNICVYYIYDILCRMCVYIYICIHVTYMYVYLMCVKAKYLLELILYSSF